MVLFEMPPASAKPSAAPCAAASASLNLCLVIEFHLENRSSRLRHHEAGPVQRQVILGQQSERYLLFPAQILPVAFGKTVDDKR